MNKAYEIFKKHYPDVTTIVPPGRYGMSGRYAWEIREGPQDQPWAGIFLVTVLDTIGNPEKGVWMGDLIQAFVTEEEADDYVARLGASQNN